MTTLFDPERQRFACPALVCIDLDGTLVDSALDLHAAVNVMQTQRGAPTRTIEQVREWVGNGLERLVERAIGGALDARCDTEALTEAIPRFRAAYATSNGHFSRLYPGVNDGLTWLRSLGCTLVCVTNKPERFARPLLERFSIDERFDFVIGGDSVTAKKPDPLPLLHAAEQFGIAPEQALMIGDSVHDIQAARAAAFAVIGVSYGYNHGRSLATLEPQLQPDLIVDSFAELMLWIDPR